jgi:hypothetical protein
MRNLVALGVVLAAAGTGCSEQPRPGTAPTPMDRVMEENQNAAVALVHAAKAVARKAGDRAQEAADAAREAFDAVVGSGSPGDARE